MTQETARLALPLIAAGQAQKELFHNEALARLDALVQGAVVAAGIDTPPGTPEPGDAWIVGSAATGAWAGRGGEIAWWTAGGWRFAAPRTGMMLWVRATSTWAVRGDAGWTIGDLAASRVLIGGVPVIGARRAAIADPTGGATVDGEARTTLAAVLATLRGHGLIAT